MGFFDFGGSGLIQSATVTLTDAQIKALPSGDFNVVPPVGASQFILPVACIVNLGIIAPYTNVLNNGGAGGADAELIVWFRVGGNPFPVLNAGATIKAPSVGVVSAASINQMSTVPQTQLPDAEGGVGPALVLNGVSGANVDLSSANIAIPQFANMVLGDALDLHVNNGVLGNFTGGDPLNTLKVTVLYSVLDV